MAADRMIPVEVVYALPHEQMLFALRVPQGTTVRQAVELSGIRVRYPGIDPARDAVGIFGKKTSPDTMLRPGDRIEIYRPLTADPKERRRHVARKGKTASGAD